MNRADVQPGDSFHYLTVVKAKVEQRTASGSYKLLVRCVCGTEKTVEWGHLRRGETKSCGCLRGQLVTESQALHSPLAKLWETRWRSMMSRCYKANNNRYARYGARGIVVEARWHDLEVFAQDMQELRNDWPAGAPFQIDRKNNEGNYEKSNVRLVSPKANARNRENSLFVQYRGQKMPMAEAIELSGLEPSVVYYRHKAGWPEDRLFVAPGE